jgi:hypothetical protein
MVCGDNCSVGKFKAIVFCFCDYCSLGFFGVEVYNPRSGIIFEVISSDKRATATARTRKGDILNSAFVNVAYERLSECYLGG